jgi:hypothetical protein
MILCLTLSLGAFWLIRRSDFRALAIDMNGKKEGFSTDHKFHSLVARKYLTGRGLIVRIQGEVSGPSYGLNEEGIFADSERSPVTGQAL